MVQNNDKEMYKKVCCKCKVAFLLIGFIVVVFHRSRCLHLVFSINRFYIFEETINIKESFAFSPSKVYILKIYLRPELF